MKAAAPQSQSFSLARLFNVMNPAHHRKALRRAAAARVTFSGLDTLEPRAMFSAAPAGTIVYMSPGAGGSYDIYAMNADGTNVRNITNNTALDGYPQVSEDGTMVAFASDRAAPGTGKLDVYTMNIDGSNVRRITTDGASWDPAFNYDKTKILFTSTAGGLYDIYTANADGTGRVNVSHNPGVDEFASWNDDGTKIVFASYRDADAAHTGNEEIYIMDANGDNQTRLTFDTTRDNYPAMSADGRIAFTAERDGNREIYVMNSDGSNPHNITNSPYTDQIPYWEPDGDHISYTSYRDLGGNGDVYVMNSDGSENHRVTFGSGQDVYAGWGELAPALTIADAAITEGNSGTKLLNFTVTLSKASDQTVTVVYNTSPGTAVSSGLAADFVAAVGTVTFAPGVLTQNISVTINGDKTVEPNETFTVNLSNPVNATIADKQAIGTITNDDTNPPGTLGMSTTSYPVSEAGPYVAITVNRTGGSGGVVSVSYTTYNSTAIAGSDYTAVSGVLNWASGDASPRTIIVPIINDSIYETSEKFYMVLSNATGGATLGTSAAYITITDNDPAPVAPQTATTTTANSFAVASETQVDVLQTVRPRRRAVGRVR